MNQARPTLLLSLALLLAWSPCASALTLEDYRAQLVELQAMLQRQELTHARELARKLMENRIRQDDLETETDHTLLRPIADAPDLQTALRQQDRLRSLLGELNQSAQPLAGPAAADSVPPPDDELLRRLRLDRLEFEPTPGGELGRPQPVDLSVGDWLVRSVQQALEAIREAIEDALRGVWRWLRKYLYRDQRPGMGELDVSRALVVVFVVALLITVLVLLLTVWRHRRRRPSVEVASSPPAVSVATDEDARSRTSSGWEAYAEELAAAGRFREAIRAWYHAVLSTLFQQGELRFRKGSTNWEYAAALPPERRWRPRFQLLVRHFDRVWYGMAASTAEEVRDYREAAQALLDELSQTRAERNPEQASP